jgi:hypothetical protein
MNYLNYSYSPIDSLKNVKAFLFSETAPLSALSFNQNSVISQLDSKKNKTLLEFVERFDGLCELICNRILLDSLLGNGKNCDSIKNRVVIEKLNHEKIKKSHLLDVYSIFSRMLAFLFGIYPDNIFSCVDQWRLTNKTSKVDNKIRSVNRKILGKGLEKIKDGETLKLEIFSKEGFNFSGHSLLIKKMTNDNYIFFDPNTGERRNLTFVQLSDNIDEQLKLWNGTDVFLTRGKDFIKRLREKIGETALETTVSEISAKKLENIETPR